MMLEIFQSLKLSNYLETANNALKSAITAVDCPVINYGNIYKYLRYNSALDLQFLKIGVINNGKE